MNVTIVDYNSGNISSVINSFKEVAKDKVNIEVTSDLKKIKSSDKVVLPGQGSFKSCVDALNNISGLVDTLSKFAINDKDTGSAEVQIAVQTERINNLIEHFKNHKHDNHSKRGLVALVNNRKKLLSYLFKKDNEKYMKLIKELNIRG